MRALDLGLRTLALKVDCRHGFKAHILRSTIGYCGPQFLFVTIVRDCQAVVQ